MIGFESTLVVAAIAGAAVPAAVALHELTHVLVAAMLGHDWSVDVRALEVTVNYGGPVWHSWLVAAAPLIVGCVAGLSYWALAGGPPGALGLALVPGYLWYTFGGGLDEYRFDDIYATQLDWGRQPSDD